LGTNQGGFKNALGIQRFHGVVVSKKDTQGHQDKEWKERIWPKLDR
jgi:hypothetical protein